MDLHQYPEEGLPIQLVIDLQPDKDYWLALGEFIEGFALTELTWFVFLTQTAHLKPSIARALFGGAHADAYTNHITRIWSVEAPTEELKAEVAPIIARFGEINSTRNIIIHYASFLQGFESILTTEDGLQLTTEDGQPLVARTVRRISSDIARAIDPKQTRERQISGAIVRDMTADLLRMRQQLMSLIMWPGVPLDVRANQMPELRNAWRYTPMPVHPKKPRKRSKSDRKQERKRAVQRKASPE